MNQGQHITKHEKGKHLTFLERAIIQVRLSDKWSPYRIAKEIGCSSNTVWNEITTDNGSEFSSLSELEKAAGTLVYYAHPYSSYEKGSDERHNGLIRRFLPKGKRIDSLLDDDISMIETWCNTLPRKILQYETPRKLFRQALAALNRPA